MKKSLIYISALLLSTSVIAAMTLEEQKDEHLLSMIHEHQDINKLTDGGKERIEELKKMSVENLTATQEEILFKIGVINKQVHAEFLLLQTLLKRSPTNYASLVGSGSSRFPYRENLETVMLEVSKVNPQHRTSLQKKLIDIVNTIPLKATNIDEEKVFDMLSSKEVTKMNPHEKEYLHYYKYKTEGLTDIQKKISQALSVYEKTRPQW